MKNRRYILFLAKLLVVIIVSGRHIAFPNGFVIRCHLAILHEGQCVMLPSAIHPFVDMSDGIPTAGLHLPPISR